MIEILKYGYEPSSRMVDILADTIPLQRVNLLHLLANIKDAGKVEMKRIEEHPMFLWACAQQLLHIYLCNGATFLVTLADRGKQLYDEMTQPDFLTQLFAKR